MQTLAWSNRWKSEAGMATAQQRVRTFLCGWHRLALSFIAGRRGSGLANLTVVPHSATLPEPRKSARPPAELEGSRLNRRSLVFRPPGRSRQLSVANRRRCHFASSGRPCYKAPMQAVLDYLKKNKPRFIQELCDYVRFP